MSLSIEEIFEKYPDVFKKLHDFYQCRVQDTVEKAKTNLKKKGTKDLVPFFY